MNRQHYPSMFYPNGKDALRHALNTTNQCFPTAKNSIKNFTFLLFISRNHSNTIVLPPELTTSVLQKWTPALENAWAECKTIPIGFRPQQPDRLLHARQVGATRVLLHRSSRGRRLLRRPRSNLPQRATLSAMLLQAWWVSFVTWPRDQVRMREPNYVTVEYIPRCLSVFFFNIAFRLPPSPYALFRIKISGFVAKLLRRQSAADVKQTTGIQHSLKQTKRREDVRKHADDKNIFTSACLRVGNVFSCVVLMWSYKKEKRRRWCRGA